MNSAIFTDSNFAQEGDLVQLQGTGHRSHLLVLEAGAVLQTHRGVIRHDDIIGTAWGTRLESHQGNPFYLLQPSLSDLIKGLKRGTQIMYPKEISYILFHMGIGPGKRVIECGTGSGGLTTALAYMVGTTGKVYSYERKAQIQDLAIKNLTKFGLQNRVDFKIGNAEDGFDEENVDAIILDLPNPQDYLHHVRKSLRGGGSLGMILPTFNQVEIILRELKLANFAMIEVSEILQRFYKTDWARLRPVDRMIGHTGFLIFGRKVDRLAAEDSDDEAFDDEQGNQD
ncbi:MAG TPA: tRNA (adenine-N1)-methyltransferase [Anaerolineaceae bacterium]|nr:tRNA (adenine-N1)-methyltransferase [Anaerolineaceae bacterium]